MSIGESALDPFDTSLSAASVSKVLQDDQAGRVAVDHSLNAYEELPVCTGVQMSHPPVNETVAPFKDDEPESSL